MTIRWIEGTGNRFALVDCVHGDAPPDPAALAIELASDERQPDGLLVLDRPGPLRMTIYNKDGSRPEACGNGLRCIAWHAVDVGHVAHGQSFEIDTDAGMRFGIVEDEARVSMGAGQILGRREVEFDGQSLTGTFVDMGNPHFVIKRDELRDEEVLGWGERLQSEFDEGANIEFVSGHRVRVFERGVGETQACGTGACAVALALGAALPVTLELPGGRLTVSRSSGELMLAGAVRRIDG